MAKAAMRTALAKPEVDYGYINARIRAMKSQLFDRSFIESLLAMKSAEDVIAALGNTSYRGDIERGSVKYPGIAGIEEGLKDHLSTSYNKVVKVVGGNKEASRLLNLLLGRWDLHNLRTVIRGKHSGATDEEIKSQLIPAGSLDEVTLTELTKQPDVKACIDLLANWKVPYAKPLQEGFRLYLNTGNLADLETSLDRFYYEFALAETEPRALLGHSQSVRLVREFFKREIDFVNIMSALRLVKEHLAQELMKQRASEGAVDFPAGGVSKRAGVKDKDQGHSGLARYFIDGGRELSVSRLVGLAMLPEVEDLVEALRGTSYGQTLGEGLKRFFETGSISVLERIMEEGIIKSTVALFRQDPLNFSQIIAYLWAKFNEVVNLRIVLHGKAVGMQDDRIREALVLV